MTVTGDGTVYVLKMGIQRINKDRKIESVRPGLTDRSSGLVALPDGSLVFGKDHSIQKYGRDQQVSVLAGIPGKARAATARVPEAAAAAGFTFGDSPVVPVGVRPDGALILLDGDVVWSLTKGRLTRVYELPAADRKTRALFFAGNAAVDRNGTVYVTSAPTDTSAYAHVADILVIRRDGKTTPIELPRTVEGVQGKPAGLEIAALTADGADGIYVVARDSKGTYVLHLHADQADLVARSRYDAHGNTADTQACTLKHAVNAKELPCALPWSLGYGDGKLVLGGNEHYLLQIGIK